MVFDKPITIQKLNEETEKWTPFFALHARVNKTSGSEYQDAGASRSQAVRTFEVRYFRDLEDIALHTQLYRIIYRDHTYNVVDYDDYMEQHKNIKLVGESYGD